LHLTYAIGKSGPAPVEHEDSTARGKPFDVANEKRLLPRRKQISRRATYKNDVQGTRTNDLVRDRDVATAGVAHFGRLHQPKSRRSRSGPGALAQVARPTSAEYSRAHVSSGPANFKVRIERLLLGGLMSAVAFLLDRRLRKLQR